MERELVIKERALKRIISFSKTIYDSGYPERADKFANQLFKFAEELRLTAESFSLCRHGVFQKKGFRCIPFKKNYIFIISITPELLIIHNIVHAKQIR